MIGWYVHHHGAGHLTRFVAVARHLRTPVTGLSSLPRPAGWDGGWVQLARDDEGPAVDPTAGGTLHWVPRHDRGLLSRTSTLVDWLSTQRPSLMVVDVSVEVALTARLCGIPVVIAAMPGDRSDRAHATAYDLADHLLAPWPADAHQGWPDHWRAKTWHVGGVSRFGAWAREGEPDPKTVLVLWGRGGRTTTDQDVVAAQSATPEWQWRQVDPTADAAGVWAELGSAGVVVTHAGQNSVAEVAAAGRPAVVVAQPRPHGEQEATARSVDRLGLAVGRTAWPEPQEWSNLLRQAAERGGERWQHWGATGGETAARRLDDRVRELAP